MGDKTSRTLAGAEPVLHSREVPQLWTKHRARLQRTNLCFILRESFPNWGKCRQLEAAQVEQNICPMGQIGTLHLHRDPFVASGCQFGNCPTVGQLDVDATRAVLALSGRRLASMVRPGGRGLTLKFPYCGNFEHLKTSAT